MTITYKKVKGGRKRQRGSSKALVARTSNRALGVRRGMFHPSHPAATVNTNSSVGYSMQKQLLGDKWKVMMPYFDSGLSIPTGGAVGGLPYSYVFRANSLYDPDYTGVGHQPLGYDQFSPMYKQYCVVGVKIKARMRAFNTYPMLMGCFVSSDLTLPSPTINIVENGPGVWTCGNVGAISAGYETGGNIQVVEYYLDIAKFTGSTDVLGDDNLRATVGGAPTNIIYIHFWASNTGTQTLAANTQLDYVSLEFDVVWLEPEPLAYS